MCDRGFWLCVLLFFFFFKQKTAYEMRISDWSSDVCSSDLRDLVTAAIIFLVGRELIDARVAVGEPQMPRDRQSDTAEFAGHDRAIGLRRRLDGHQIGRAHV